MDLNEIRSKYLQFFKERGHTIIPSSSLVPENDPTTLFTGSGMQPLVPYLLGKNHPAGARLVNSQKCFRAMDIEEVGDNRHTTFFEMLGNWSLGDYFKEEQLSWYFEFLTKEMGIDPHRLYVTVFAGEPKYNIPHDDESVAIWKKLFAEKGIEVGIAAIGSEEGGYQRGIKPGERIFFYNAKKNWWSRAGTPEHMPAGEPGGPDSEVFFEFPDIEHDTKYGLHCHPNCDCGRFVEIGNSVFMQYIKNEDGTFSLLPKQNVDFGGGLERIAMAANDSADIFIVTHAPIIALLETLSGKKYGNEQSLLKSFRIIADHMKGATFLIASGVQPANTERGYFVRRLIRRSVVHADRLGIKENMFTKVVEPVATMYLESYLEVRDQIRKIEKTIDQEEKRFRETLAKGLREFGKIVGGEPSARRGTLRAEGSPQISGEQSFVLFSTYGFPFEVTQELAAEKGMSVDEKEFHELMKKHQELSRAGASQRFAGGLADHAEKTIRLHTVHHLLLKALQIVLGPDVKQQGSNITQERLRIDFLYPQKMTPEQIAEVERIVNEKIAEDLPVIRSEMSREEAEKLGAEHEFGQKYPERVSVYSIGSKYATPENPKFEERFSIEFCGGPHVTHTGELAEGGRKFKIQKEEAVAQGIRRVRAVLE